MIRWQFWKGNLTGISTAWRAVELIILICRHIPLPNQTLLNQLGKEEPEGEALGDRCAWEVQSCAQHKHGEEVKSRHLKPPQPPFPPQGRELLASGTRSTPNTSRTCSSGFPAACQRVEGASLSPFLDLKETVPRKLNCVGGPLPCTFLTFRRTERPHPPPN